MAASSFTFPLFRPLFRLMVLFYALAVGFVNPAFRARQGRHRR